MPGGMRVGQRFRSDVLTLGQNLKSDVLTLGQNFKSDVLTLGRHPRMVPHKMNSKSKSDVKYLPPDGNFRLVNIYPTYSMPIIPAIGTMYLR